MFCCACFYGAQAPENIRRLEAEAKALLSAQNANGALTKYKELARLVPRSAVYQDEIGFLLAATNRTSEAIPYFEQARSSIHRWRRPGITWA